MNKKEKQKIEIEKIDKDFEYIQKLNHKMGYNAYPGTLKVLEQARRLIHDENTK